jgi:hypothetical protein
MQAYNNWYTAYQANTNRPETYYLKSNWRESRRYKLNETPNLTLYTTLTPIPDELYQKFEGGVWVVDTAARTEADRVAFNLTITSQINTLELSFQQQYLREIILGINVAANTAALTTLDGQVTALKAQIIPPPD